MAKTGIWRNKSSQKSWHILFYVKCNYSHVMIHAHLKRELISIIMKVLCLEHEVATLCHFRISRIWFIYAFFILIKTNFYWFYIMCLLVIIYIQLHKFREKCLSFVNLTIFFRILPRTSTILETCNWMYVNKNQYTLYVKPVKNLSFLQ